MSNTIPEGGACRCKLKRSQKKEFVVRLLEKNPGLTTEMIVNISKISKTHINRIKAWIKKGDKKAVLDRYSLPEISSSAERVLCLGPCHEEDFYFLSTDRIRNRLCNTCREFLKHEGSFTEYKVGF